MALIESWVKCELSRAVQVQYLQGNLFSADNQGNLVGVRVFENGEPASLSGSVSANVIRADGTTVPVAGTLTNGNECYVILPQAAYAVTGVVTIVIKITASSVVTTLAAIVSTVYASTTDAIVDPGTIIPSIETLIAAIEAAVATIPADYSSLWATIAPAYTSLTFPVSKGQYCTNNGHMYRAKQDIATSETFTSSHWEVCNVGVELFNQIGAGNQAISELKSALVNLTNKNRVHTYLNMVFQRGRLDGSDGTIKSASYRISTTDIQQFDYDIVFSVNTGYRMFFCLYNSDGTYSSINTGFLTSDYIMKKGQKFRMTIALVTEDSSVPADIEVFATNAFMTSYSYDEIEDIKHDLYSPMRCKALTDKGENIDINDCTLTATNVEVVESGKTKFSKGSKLIRIKKMQDVSSYELNIQLPKTINANRFFLTFNMTRETTDTSIGSYFNVRINNLSNNLAHSNGNAIAENWNNLLVHFSTEPGLTNIKLIFSIRSSVEVGDYCGEYWIDSITFNSFMKPTFILNFDQWWQDSIDNGGYQYCFANNVPFTMMTKNYDTLSQTFKTLAKTAETVYGCENSYYASYGDSNSSLLNASTYEDAKDEVDAMKNDFINEFGHDFISFGCTQMKLNYIDRTALRNAGIKMIRGGASGMMIPYYDDEDYFTQPVGISSDDHTLAQVKAMIDDAVKYGYCMLAFTHGVCDDDTTVMSGSTSNGMQITDFKAMVDYLVSLRSLGKIQICTMEDWYHQCVK